MTSTAMAHHKSAARGPASTTARLGIGAMGTLMVLSAAVQYNDPDPYPWIALYLAAAVTVLFLFLMFAIERFVE